jgi:hypothetical protein
VPANVSLKVNETWRIRWLGGANHRHSPVGPAVELLVERDADVVALPVGRRHVEPAIAVQVSQGHYERCRIDFIVFGRPERAVSVAQQHADAGIGDNRSLVVVERVGVGLRDPDPQFKRHGGAQQRRGMELRRDLDHLAEPWLATLERCHREPNPGQSRVHRRGRASESCGILGTGLEWNAHESGVKQHRSKQLVLP